MIQLLFTLLCLSSVSQARVFNLAESRFGGYFSFTHGSSDVGTDYFEGESSATSFSKGFKTNQGGEFGFVYNTGAVNWIFGLEVIKPQKAKGEASTGATTNYFYSSEISVYTPKVGIELVFYQTPTTRVFANGLIGTASLSSKTNYSGLNIAPNADFSIEGKGTANSINYAIGSEWHWTDNTTVVLSIGQRQLNFKKIKYLDDVTSSFTGAHSKGEQIRKSDGSALEYDFSNTYFTLGFRFWMH